MYKKTRITEGKEKKTYVFGSGRFADKFIECYRNDYDIVGVVDNDQNKWGNTWKSLQVYSPEILRNQTDCQVIVCIKNYEPIIQQLAEMGINDAVNYDAHKIYPGRQADMSILCAGKQYHIGLYYLTNITAINKKAELFTIAKGKCDYLIVAMPAQTASDPEEAIEIAKLTEKIIDNESVDELLFVPTAYCSAINLLEKYHYDVFFTEQKLTTPYWNETKQTLNQHGAELLYLSTNTRARLTHLPLLSTYKNIKRLGIYAFYEKDGIVDEYVIRFLKSFISVADRLVMVSNGKLKKEGQKAIEELGCELLIRENEGFDAWGVRTGLLHVGFDNLNDYDEILVANNTIFGPFYDLTDMLDEMATRDVDFWGVSAHPGFATYDPYGSNPYGYVPEHIQSYFYGVRKSMFSDTAFHAFWHDLPKLTDYKKAIGLYETVMTQHFSDEGFLWDVYMPKDEYYDMTDNPLITMPVESVKKWKCPFVKRRAFFQDYDYYTTYTGQHTVSYLMQFLEEETNYPVDLIWKNLIRTCHMSILVQNMHLARILEKEGKTDRRHISKAKTALFMHVYDTSMLPILKGYADNLPEHTHIHVSTTSEEKKKEIEDTLSERGYLDVRVLPNIGRDVSALLVSFRDVIFDYDYICVTHDKKTSYLKPECVGEGFAYMGYENILASRDYVESVFKAFDNDPFLGLLYAPDPNHADFITHIGLEWGQNYDCTLALYKELGLTVPIDKKYPPMAPFGSSFWCRTKALKPLYNKVWTYDDFPEASQADKDGSIMHAVERIYPYVAQQAGFYSALLMTTDYAAVEIDNLQFYARDYTHICKDFGISGYYIDTRRMFGERLDRAMH